MKRLALAIACCASACIDLATPEFLEPLPLIAGRECGESCPSHQECAGNDDCASHLCLAHACAAPSCADGVANGNETDRDCGGACPNRCAEGKTCGGDGDCTSGLCVNGGCAVVVEISCTNGFKDAMEVDVDCGGPCHVCAIGQACTTPTDCAGGLCNSDGLCTSPSCSDGLTNGDETHVDCGGSCPDCPIGTPCASPSECASGACDGTCVAPSCWDGVKNGGESDVDCGGSCRPCAKEKACQDNADCWNGECSNHVCTATCPESMATIYVSSPSTSFYCMDKVEVSHADYAAWLPKAPAVPLTACAWKTSYAPNTSDESRLCTPPSDDALPVTCVDHCDARSYCAGQGKRLCGKIGGGLIALSDYPANSGAKDAAVSQWYNACSQSGTSTYCDGDVWSGECNAGTASPWISGSGALCHGAQENVIVYDQTGNVSEWEDACNAVVGENDRCLMRGGSYGAPTGSPALRCDDVANDLPRAWYHGRHGFRCCAG